MLPTGELPFSVTFERADGVLSATMDIQGAMDLPLTAVSHENDRVHFELETPIGLAAWDGALTGDTIEGEGEFTQGVVTATFSVSRADLPEAEAEEPVPVPGGRGLVRERRRTPRGHADAAGRDGTVPGRRPDHGLGTPGPG